MYTHIRLVHCVVCAHHGQIVLATGVESQTAWTCLSGAVRLSDILC